jgi:hypothetical protein
MGWDEWPLVCSINIYSRIPKISSLDIYWAFTMA